MSDEIKYIDVDDDQYEGTPRALREHVDKLQKALKAEKTATAELRGQAASSALSGVLTGFKNAERVKAALLGDKVDPLDSEAVSKWLEANGDDYAKASGEPAPVQNQEPEPDPYTGIRGIEQIATPPSTEKWDTVQGLITEDMDGEAVRALLRKHGV